MEKNKACLIEGNISAQKLSSSWNYTTGRKGKDLQVSRSPLQSIPSEKFGALFRMEPRDQDYPTITPPTNSDLMEKATRKHEGDRQENRDESSITGLLGRTLKFLRPLWRLFLKR